MRVRRSTDDVVPDIEAQGGRIREPSARPVVGTTGRWRLIFDLEGTADGPVELRAHLRRGDRPLSETWIALAEREEALDQ
jgi:glucans biosynthesis protein